MRLYVIDKTTGEKIHLQLVADSRQHLAAKIGATSFNVNNQRFHANEVFAETGTDQATVSALIGGVIGMLGGAPGVIAGSAIGALLGSNQAQKEKDAAALFNGSAV